MVSSRIKILPEEVSNRIAAGEVVERPASVVKELVENAIDAGSRSIRVEVAEGGCGLIRVVDDGGGMDREDALLAFARHATSKLSCEQDLLTLQTLGFRGEALPSIASISKVRMVTTARGAPLATEVLLEGGNLKKVCEVGAPPGTLVEVQDLFYNTPARRKFLKSMTTELSRISHLVLQQSLAYPSLHFQLYRLGEQGSHELYNLTPVGNVGDRLFQLFGGEFCAQLLSLEHRSGSMALEGYVSRPLFTRGERNQQELFVNSRPVRNPGVSHALYEAYDTLLTRGRHPVIFLFLQMDPALVDVNVHPSKREVRFREPRTVHECVRGTVRQRLMESGRLDPTQTDVNEGREKLENMKYDGEIIGERVSPDSGFRERIREAAERYLRRETAVGPVSGERGSPQIFPAELARVPESHPRLLKEEWIPVAQIHETFILAVADRDLYIIDQHTAHERVLFERFLRLLGISKIDLQQLLIPVPLELSVPEFLLLNDHLEDLRDLGLELEGFGERTFLLRSVPAFTRNGDYHRLIVDILDDLRATESIPSTDERRKKMVATMACRSAVRAHRPMKGEEMRSLLLDLQATDLPYTCPHGRPTMIKLEGAALERLFWRR